MSSTSTTQYYGLTQYVGTDKPDFADNNVAFRDVDAALHGVVQDAEGFATDITNLQTDVAAAQSDITTLQTDLDTAEAAIVTINNKDLAQDAEIARVDTNSKDMITAYNEASATSTHAYAIGDYFIYNNVLYKATAAIAIGDTIVPDTNCATTNVTSELIQLNSDLADFKNDEVAILNTPVYAGFYRLNSELPITFCEIPYISPASAITANTAVNLGTLPEDFRPNTTKYSSAVIVNPVGALLAYARMAIGTDGAVNMWCSADIPTTASMFATFTFV